MFKSFHISKLNAVSSTGARLPILLPDDQIGNRKHSSENAENMTYIANALNQYSSISNTVNITPAHDADGNVTNLGAFAFVWDAENRLISVSSNGSTIASYKYDYMSRRVEKAVNGVTNTFIYDGWAMIQETSSSGATNTFVYGLDLSGSLQGAGTIGGILYGNFSGTNAFYFADGNGNITELADSSGNILAHYEFDPYGNTVTRSGSLSDVNPWKFSSKYFDKESGLGYWGRRYYHPETGRWINRDPIEESGGLLLYGFVRNSPIWLQDFLGEDWKVERNGGETAIAEVVSTAGLLNTLLSGSTVRELADRIGLAPDEYKEWLQPDDGARMPAGADVKLYCRKFKIPNTVITYWGLAHAEVWWLGGFDEWLIKTSYSYHWQEAYFQTLGFNVSNIEQIKGKPSQLQKLMEDYSKKKWLHGVYELSHGDLSKPSVGNSYKEWELDPTSVKLSYKMGLGLFFSCGSDSPAFHKLVHKRGIFAGFPVGQNHHPEYDEVQAENYIAIPDQETGPTL